MYLKNIKLINFKNIENKSFFLSEKINCFVGNNGIGKTNILDAIHYLCLTKSYLNSSDIYNISFNKDFFTIEGNFISLEAEDQIRITVQENHKKKIVRNNKPYLKLSDHIGKYPCVIISPYDQNLITAGSEFRRKFLDGMISQINFEYLHSILRYNKILQQRNALLKSFLSTNNFDALNLEIYDSELIKNGNFIYQIRKEFLEKYIHQVIQYYKILCAEEKIEIQYKSDLNTFDFAELLKNSLKKDRQAGYTTSGIHKDDLEFLIFDHPIKKTGSQGQQKSFLIALKLAQINIFKEYKKHRPLLLLDDIFDKLDDERVSQLVEITHLQSEQIFITDTHKERTEEIVKKISDNYIIFDL